MLFFFFSFFFLSPLLSFSLCFKTWLGRIGKPNRQKARQKIYLKTRHPVPVPQPSEVKQNNRKGMKPTPRLRFVSLSSLSLSLVFFILPFAPLRNKTPKLATCALRVSLGGVLLARGARVNLGWIQRRWRRWQGSARPVPSQPRRRSRGSTTVYVQRGAAR